MANTAHLKFRKRISLTAFHAYLQQALMATFGDALTLDGAATDQGSNLKNDGGVCLVQFWYESKGHISVDHRYGAVGYMVSDAMLSWLARHLNGRVLETGTGQYLDLTREYSVYFMDTVRRQFRALEEHYAETLDPGAHGQTLAQWEANHKAIQGHVFTGKFARFWDRAGVPIEEEAKPWDMGACERCCLCRDPTRWWTILPDRKPGEQVALCPGCAINSTPKAIPTKRAWCDKEAALDPRPRRLPGDCRGFWG